MTTTHSLLAPDRLAGHGRRSRRRWVPKGVMLLIVLFVIGLMSACHSPGDDASLAEIVVPFSQSTAYCMQTVAVRQSAATVLSEPDARWSGLSEPARMYTF